MSDQPGRLEGGTLDEKLHGIDDETFLERHRTPVLVGFFALAVLLALVVGWQVNQSQDGEHKANVVANKAQAETYSLAQQVAAACASSKLTTDERTRICDRAEEITKQGPRGPVGPPGQQGIQGIPGEQGIPGVPGEDGKDGKDGKDGENGKDGAAGPAGTDGKPGPAGADGKDGAQGPPGPAGKDGKDGEQGPAGKDGKDGAIGPMGPAGKDGEPPYSWVTYDSNGKEIERCQRSSSFDPAQPTYTCTRSGGGPLSSVTP